MDTEVINQTGTLWDLLQNQLNILLAVLSRPVVQQQIVAILVILLISWLLPEMIRRRWLKRHAVEDLSDEPKSIRRLAALFHLYTPILALILIYVAIWLFERMGIPHGLLGNFSYLVFVWLLYRGIISMIYARYGESVRPYRNWIITPLFILLIMMQIVTILPGSINLVNATLDLGTISVSIGNFMTALIIFYIFIVAAWVIKQTMVQVLPGRLDAEPGVIESIATLVRYFLLSVGLILSLGVLGLDFTSLAIIAGGLSVGIGIGLQETVSNFVSGLVLLFEQSLRPGDVIEMNGRISRVERISLRATTVRTRTNEELIIPNNRFTTDQIKNFTRSDRLVQVLVPIGVSYKSDPQFVKQLAIETALTHPLVLKTPAPRLIFLGYGNSSLDFNLAVSTNHPEMTPFIKSDMYYLLWNVFAEHNIQIPFPQRDLNLGTGWEKFAADLGGAEQV